MDIDTPLAAAQAAIPVRASPVPGLILTAELGNGPLGTVWQARRVADDRPIALRLLPTGIAPREVERLLHDLPILVRLRHRHLVPCLHGGLTAAGTPFLLWDYAGGPTLAAWIEHHGRLAPALALALVRDLAGVLETALEAGLHHGAVSAGNVIVDARQGPAAARLADLGTPRPRRDDADGAESRAPEEFDDPDTVDYRVDVYGLGCVLYHALVGSPPFAGRSLKGMVRAKITGEIPQAVQARADVPLAVNELINSLMDPRQDLRPQSYRDVRERCERLLGADRRPLGRHGDRAAWIGVAAVVAILGGLAWRLGAPVPAPMAGTPSTARAIDAPSGDEAAWAVSRSLLVPDPSLRLAAWLADQGAVWSADPERADGVLGRTGRLHRPIEHLPVRLVATVRLAGGTGRVALGVILADGSEASIGVTSLGPIIHATVDPPGAGEPVSLPGGRAMPVSLELRADTLVATIAGNRFDPLPLKTAPKDLYLEATGEEPVAIHGLGLQARR